MSSTGFEKETAEVRSRRVDAKVDAAVDQQVAGKKQYVAPAPTHDGSLFTDYALIESIVMPILFTAVAAFTRLYRIGTSYRVVWDEAHFGKFGSFYLKHEYYFDVHPPLGKMLCGLSGYLANYNGSFGFESGAKFPEGMDYATMREFNALFAILVVPSAYFTAKALKFSLPTVWLITTMVTLELSYVTLGRFILLDSMLMCFTVFTFLALVKFHYAQDRPFSVSWFKWLVLTGLSIGLTTSVKMVGLFVMGVVGIYTAFDLWLMWGERSLSSRKYTVHWISRIFSLIIVPLLVFAACYKVHFALLTKTGDGVASMSSLFKANLEGSDIESGPLDLAIGSRVTLKNQGLGTGLLHSHVQTMPEGSKQQQVTTYSHIDGNNEWVIDYPRWQPSYTHDQDIRLINDGELVRLTHFMTGRNLHSHEISGPVSRREWEVSCYGNDTIGDEKDNWIVEITETIGNEDPDTIHPLTTSFRLRHAVLGCYLGVSGQQLPEWGFSQGEVICHKNPSYRNKNTWWNVDGHWNARLPEAFNRTLPKSKFTRDFVQLNVAQMASNNALIPDPDKDDHLASSWWEWPILRRGLRLCGWGDDQARFYLMMTPSTAWLSTAAVAVFISLAGVYVLAWQRQAVHPTPAQLEALAIGGVLPFLGWLLHYLPFIIMSRVTYFHHYMPALYFAIFVLGFLLELSTARAKPAVKAVVYIALHVLTIGMFVYFSPVAFGMEGDPADFNYMQWFKNWNQGS